MAVAADASGNVFVVMDLSPNGSGPDSQLWKFDGAGRKVWSVKFPDGLWDSRSLAVLPSGDVAAGACSVAFCFPPEGTTMTSVVLRFSGADGHVVWRAGMPGPTTGGVTADGDGRVMAVSGGPPTSSPEGTPARVVLIASGGGILLDHATDIRFAIAALGGTSGDFIVAGQDVNARPVFERRRTDGALVFREVLDTQGGIVNRVAFAPNGSIALGGWFQNGLTVGRTSYAQRHAGFLVVAGGDSSPQWSTVDQELTPLASVPPTIAFGRENDVVAFTMTFGKGQANLRSYTRDGVLRWRHDFRGTFGTWVNTVAVARNGDIIVGANGTADAPFQALTYPRETHFVAVLAR
jgi:hypothetical protein